MKNLFTILLCVCSCLLFCAGAYAQSSSSLVIDASSLTPVNTDEITGLAIDPIGLDGSNRPCARIKLHINRMTPEEVEQIEVRTPSATTDIRKTLVSYNRDGLIIEITAKPITSFYLYHPKYGDSNKVDIPLQGNKEYKMEAWNETRLSIVVTFPESGAEVYLDDVFRGFVENNHLTISDLTMGHHNLSFKYSAGDYRENIYISPASIYFEIDPERKGAVDHDIPEPEVAEPEETADSDETEIPEIISESEPEASLTPTIQDSDKQQKTKVRPSVKGRTLLMASAGVFPQTSYGAMVGYAKKVGAYAKFRSSFNSMTPSYTVDIEDFAGDGMYTSGKDPHHYRLQASAGLLFRLSEKIYPYFGAGYGEYSVYWEDFGGKWARVADYSCKGVAAEAGLAFRFGGFSLSVGASTTAFKYTDLEIGIGLMF